MRKILVLDDELDYRNSLARMFRYEYKVVPVECLDQAKKVMDKTISLAIIDIRLSKEDHSNRGGIIFLSWLKNNFPEVPAIIMSAYRDWDAVTDGINFGAAKFVKKPINTSELKSYVRTLINPGNQR